MAQLHFSMLTIIAIAVILIQPEPSFGLGINCDGSIECNLAPPLVTTGGSYLSKLAAQVCSMNPLTQYSPGQHITSGCFDDGGGIAVFTQKTTQNLYGVFACTLLNTLIQHGCKTCGSVPFDVYTTNDVNNGEITVNYVNSC